MKKILFSLILSALLNTSFTQTQPVPDAVLYGVIKKDNLTAAPYDKWFTVNYNAYQPAVDAISAIRKLDTKGISIEIFLGTWCGDSRREVPRFLKILDELSFSSKNTRIIGLGGFDSLYKQSPEHEETGKGIFRVPVFIVYRNGVEINRINEFPAASLEKDLHTILSNQPYIPNYRSFAAIHSWLSDGTLLDKNSNPNGLATQVRTLISGERELNSLGYLLLRHGKKEEALKIFQVNANLFPESAFVISSLGEGYYKTGDNQNAVRLLERSLELNKDPQLVKEILKVLYQVKGVKE